jgi:hypothetical protein
MHPRGATANGAPADDGKPLPETPDDAAEAEIEVEPEVEPEVVDQESGSKVGDELQQ